MSEPSRVESIEETATEWTIRQAAFWQEQEATVNGMLGGLGDLSEPDVAASRTFLDSLIAPGMRVGRCALDVGAGIGRVTKYLLLPAGYARVDLLEANARFLDTARDYVGHTGLGECFCSPMSAFDFGSRKWDLIWIQWVAIYLPDDEFVTFFRDCGRAVAQDPCAYVVLKENILLGNKRAVPDESDASVTRSDTHLKRLWQRAGLQVKQ